MNDVEILKAARALIAEPEHWCKNMAHDCHDGVEKWCALGAISEAYPESTKILNLRYLRPALPKRLSQKYVSAVVKFNDSPKTTHKMILNLYDRAIKAAEEAS